MPQLLRNTLISVRDLLATAGPLAFLTVALLAVAYWLLDPSPPRRVVLATGPEQSAYAEFGKRYQAELARYGIEVILAPTQGAADNLRRLRDPAERIDLAFVQGGASDALYAVDESREGLALVSLGRLFVEPVWVFYREAEARRRGPDPTLTQLAQLQGWRISFGTQGSGVPNLMAKLLRANRVDATTFAAQPLDETAAVVAFLDDKLDALTVASAPESPMVQMLLLTPGLKLMAFPQNQAYARRLPFLSAVTLPRGIGDLAQDVPPYDWPLVATTTSLVARADTHPALVQLFVQAAKRVHGGAGWFHAAGEFPAADDAQWPLAKEAARYYRDGPPLLQRYLPFWIANLVDRMWVVLLSLVAILIPLSRIVPPLYEFRVRSRVFRWYGQLRVIEEAAAQGRTEGLQQQLDELEARVGRITVPLSYADEVYALRTHVALVRDRLRGVMPER